MVGRRVIAPRRCESNSIASAAGMANLCRPLTAAVTTPMT